MDRKKLIVDAWKRIDEGRDLDAIDEYFSPDYVRHGRRELDVQGLRKIMSDLIAGFPDLTSETLDLVEEGDRVAYRWRSTGTHLGPYMGALPTRRTIVATGITISRFEGDKIVEDWATWNEVAVLHDLGILPIDKP